MTAITIDNLDEATERALQERAARSGRTLADEAREVLRAATHAPSEARGLGSRIRAVVEEEGGFVLPPRERQSRWRPETE